MKIYFIWCSYPTHAVFYGDPVGLVLLSGIAKSLGHQTDISLYNGSKRNLKIIQEKIRNNKYDILGISSNSVEKPLSFELLDQLKGDFIKTCGGLGPTLEPKDFQKHCDYIFVGEGEKILTEFLKQLKNKQKIKIKGVYSKTDKGPFLPADLIDDLDSLPISDYKFRFDENEVARRFLATNIGIYMGSRGCPSACKFCFNATFSKIFKGKYFRLKSVEKICRELDVMKKENPDIKSWNILDDTFLYRSIDELEKITSKWHFMKTPFDIAARVIEIKSEKIEIIVKNGLKSLNIGLERATPELRAFCNKPYFSNETLFNAIRIIKKYEVPNFVLNNMCGFPDETRQTLMQLIRLNIKIGNSFRNSPTKFSTVIYPLRLLPGSPWYNEYYEDIRRDFDPIQNHFLPNIKVKGLAEQELFDWARLFSPYVNFLIDLQNEELKNVVLDDLEKYGPTLTERRIKLLKKIINRKIHTIVCLRNIVLISWQIRNPLLLPLSFWLRPVAKFHDKFFNN